MRNLNARVGNNSIQGIKHRFNEDIRKENGESLIAFCVNNELRIIKTFVCAQRKIEDVKEV